MDAFHKDALPRGYKLAEYTIDSVLGHGGFGITYLARDTSLGSWVAIKEYLPQAVAARESGKTTVLPRPDSRGMIKDYHWGLRNFLKEARALAHFKHPNIVRVLRYIELNGTAYMVMEYEQGQSLSRYLKMEAPRLDETNMLRIFLPILNGLHAVHQAGMLHLDIKPENIYLRSDGSPMLIDFGSARQAIRGPGQGQRVALTPGYAPIEQYPDKGKQGPWTDMYAMGACMYRCMTGKRPVESLERYQAVLQYQMDPLSPAAKEAKGRYQPYLLECIDWALSIQPTDRPQTARRLQDGLMGKGRQPRVSNPFPNPLTKPTVPAAGPAPARKRLSAGRRWMWFFWFAAFAVLGTLAVSYDWRGLLGAWTSGFPGFHAANGKSSPPATPAARKKPAAPAARQPSAGAEKERRVQEAPARTAAAPSVGYVLPTAEPVPSRLLRTLSGHKDWVYTVAFSAAGRMLASAGYDKTIRLWDAASGSLLGTLYGQGYPINAVAFSANGVWLASAGEDGGIRLWDASNGQQRGALRGHGYAAYSIAFSPDSKLLASGSKDRSVIVWNVANGKRMHTFEEHEDSVYSVAFSPDGKRVASAGADKTIRIRDLASGKETVTMMGHKNDAMSIAFSPDGKRLLSGDKSGAVKLWDTRSGKLVRSMSGTQQAVLSVVFSPDGRLLAAAGVSGAIFFWDADDGRLLNTLSGHEDYVHAIAFSADGSLLASASRDNTVKLWGRYLGSEWEDIWGQSKNFLE